MKQATVTLDMEGVLTPEIWIAVAEKTKIPELHRTTRNEPDYEKLMRAEEFAGAGVRAGKRFKKNCWRGPEIGGGSSRC